MGKSTHRPKDDYNSGEIVVRCERCGYRIGYVSKSGWQILCSRCQREDEQDWFEDTV